MSKHFSIFQTENQWNAAKDSLDYPHVSLIDTTGDMHYAKYNGKEVADAPFGSILMANVATNKLFYIEDSADYNLTDYPAAQFEPIGVCIRDKESDEGGRAVFMSMKYMDYTYPDAGNYNKVNIQYGFNYINMSNIDSAFVSTNYVDTIRLNNIMKENIDSTWNWQTSSTIPYDNTSSNKYTSVGAACCWRYYTTGTTAGQWYLPTYYDYIKYKDNFSLINSIISSVLQIYCSQNITISNLITISALADNNQKIYNLGSNGSFNNGSRLLSTSSYPGSGARAVFIPHIKEL